MPLIKAEETPPLKTHQLFQMGLGKRSRWRNEPETEARRAAAQAVQAGPCGFKEVRLFGQCSHWKLLPPSMLATSSSWPRFTVTDPSLFIPTQHNPWKDLKHQNKVQTSSGSYLSLPTILQIGLRCLQAAPRNPLIQVLCASSPKCGDVAAQEPG